MAVVCTVEAVVNDVEHQANAAEASMDQHTGACKDKAHAAMDMDRMPPRASLRSVYLLNFLMVANYTVLVPKTRQYWESLGGDAETGMTLTRLLPLLKAVAAWGFLWMSRKRNVATVISTMIVGNIIGNVIFALAPLTSSRWTVFLARVILTSHEVQSVPNCYIGRAVGLRYRSEASMNNNAWFGLGFAAGPVIAFLLERIARGLSLEAKGVDAFDAETIPGWFMAVLWVFFLIVHRSCYEEPPLEPAEHTAVAPTPLSALPWIGIGMAGIIGFILALTVSSWEMWTLSMVQDRWGSPLIAGGYLAAVTIVILPLAMLSGRLSWFVDDRLGIFISFISAGLSWSFLFQYFQDPYYVSRSAEVVFFTIGSVVLLASMLLARGFFDALVSKMGPPDRKQQLITAAMSIFMLGRGVGGSLGAWFVNQNSWVGFHMSLCFTTAFGIAICLRFLVAHQSAA